MPSKLFKRGLKYATKTLEYGARPADTTAVISAVPSSVEEKRMKCSVGMRLKCRRVAKCVGSLLLGGLAIGAPVMLPYHGGAIIPASSIPDEDARDEVEGGSNEYKQQAQAFPNKTQKTTTKILIDWVGNSDQMGLRGGAGGKECAESRARVENSCCKIEQAESIGEVKNKVVNMPSEHDSTSTTCRSNGAEADQGNAVGIITGSQKSQTPVGLQHQVERKVDASLVEDLAQENDEEDELEPFRPVMAALELEALKKRALKIRHAQLGLNPSKTSRLTVSVAEKPLYGSYNLAYTLTFSDGVKWIARIPGFGANMTSALCEKRDSEYQTMRCMRNNTTMPIPEIYEWDTSHTAVGTAYALMSFMEGTPLSVLWRNEIWATEAMRYRVLSNIACCMSQLDKLRFSKIGSLRFDSNGQPTEVGPRLLLGASILSTTPWETTLSEGPYDHAQIELLSGLWQDAHTMDVLERAVSWLLTIAAGSVPSSLWGRGGFALNMDDFNYQNIIVDNEGGITGIIDWDNVGTKSNTRGFARYPSWITRDWDPAMYNIPGKGFDWVSVREDSPEQLSAYRQHYSEQFENCKTKGCDALETRLSHITEALSIAVGSSYLRPYIIERLFDHAFDSKCPFRLRDYCSAYKNGTHHDMDEEIQRAFNHMWHAEWEHELWFSKKHEICCGWIQWLTE